MPQPRRHARWTRLARSGALIAAAMLAGCVAAVPIPVAPAVSAVSTPSPVAPIPPGMQYLYGSGEAAALSMATWRGLTVYVATRIHARPADGVVLAADATLASPRFVPCAGKPLAAVFDVDETVLLNLGFEANDAAHPGPYDPARWQAWERTGATRVFAVPGARAGIAALRAMGVTVVFNTNRSAANADFTQAAIDGAGLGPAVHGDTLFLAGDDATGSHKDGRRAAIARRFCVVAMAGDQLGDFSDLFNAGQGPAARRAAVQAPAIAGLWGAGWFVLPNPVYGIALKGGMDDVFPADRRWTPVP